MTRAALYARYSDDKQNEASIEDQFRLCREHAQRERWEIVGSYEDAAISGASTILRPGIQRLMRDAQHGEFNVLLAEALDRIDLKGERGLSHLPRPDQGHGSLTARAFSTSLWAPRNHPRNLKYELSICKVADS
jgi:hypothetical protein